MGPERFQAVLREVSDQGWAIAASTLDAVACAAAGQGWEQLDSRGNPSSATAVLRPMREDTAPPRSLSAHYGLNAQPLHTDGAHLRRPPDLVVLAATSPSPTPTHVWSLPSIVPSTLSQGLFVVDGNDGPFLAPARASGRLRYDPGCMRPADHYARAVSRYFEGAMADAHRHDWTQTDFLLVIDNAHALHARGKVLAGDENRRITRLTLRRIDESL